jgi:hypothetical protein
MKKKFPAAVELGRRGGKARAKALSKKRASEIGRKAARARWRKAKKSSQFRGGGAEGTEAEAGSFAARDVESAEMLFVSQGGHGVDTRGAAGGDVAGGEAREHEQYGNSGERQGIGGGDTVEQAAHQAGGSE